MKTSVIVFMLVAAAGYLHGQSGEPEITLTRLKALRGTPVMKPLPAQMLPTLLCDEFCVLPRHIFNTPANFGIQPSRKASSSERNIRSIPKI